MLSQSPHIQNDRYWSTVNRHELVECKKAHCEKAMAWVDIIDGRCLPVVWFDGSVYGEAYLEKILMDTVWQNVKHMATRKEYWFQQNGANYHVTAQCLSFSRSKFENRIISRNTQHHWPPYSPDHSPLDYCFWIQCTQYVKKEKPKNMCDLRQCINRFAENIDEEALRKMVPHNRKRTALCIDSLGGNFEQLL